jgi:hypothetical protein
MRSPRVEEDGKKQLGLKRFPMRTLLLMILALFAFVWFWCQTHPGAKRESRPVDIQIRP